MKTIDEIFKELEKCSEDTHTYINVGNKYASLKVIELETAKEIIKDIIRQIFEEIAKDRKDLKKHDIKFVFGYSCCKNDIKQNLDKLLKESPNE